MKIKILTIFPEIFENFLKSSIVYRALQSKAVSVDIYNIRNYSSDKHKKVDDYPFGGGSGLVMMPQPIFDGITSLQEKGMPVIYFTPQGRLLNQSIINNYSLEDNILLVCGHYKEIDQRIRDNLIDDEISIGDYVLTGGEIPAMVFTDAIIRLQEGVISDIESALTDSHQDGYLGCPHYTRPANFRGFKVPEVLLSGNHKDIQAWREKKSYELTLKRRPDLLK